MDTRHWTLDTRKPHGQSKEGKQTTRECRVTSDECPNILENDLEEHFIRSSGPGGQNVNKVATCVLLIHRPTGVQVKCQSERSQYLNRLKARELLSRELARRIREEEARMVSEREKFRRKTRPKPAGLKRRILEHKRKHSEKKQARRSVRNSFREL